jgi:predicted dehydrogenase
MSGNTIDPMPHYKPIFPADRRALGIALLGFGSVAKKWHITAYRKYGLRVVGAYDTSPEIIRNARESHPEIPMYRSLEELLADSEVRIIDITTRAPGRLELIAQVLEAGKHVLAQKPLAQSIEGVEKLVSFARQRRLMVAVNQNGRWAPPWRLATLLIADGILGKVLAVTHVFDTRLLWALNLERHGSAHFLLFDYACHWIDITNCWFGNRELVGVQARDPSAPVAYDNELISQSAWIAMHYADGATALIRGVTCGVAHRGHPFWIHGSRGTLRGDVDCQDGDYLEWEHGTVRTRFDLEGHWFPDGFAGSMGELMCAINEEREPFHSLAHAALTLRASLAACQSAERRGAIAEPTAFKATPL